MAKILEPSEEDIRMMLAARCHVMNNNLDPQMERYVYKRAASGHYLADLSKTWEKLVFAARIIAAVDTSKDVVVISGRTVGQRAVHKMAILAGVTPIAARFTPGTFTNQIQKKFLEPRVLVVTDPRVDSQPLTEASYVNVPTISFCNSDSPLRYVDVAIPCNNTGRNSVGLLYWLLTREVLRIRGVLKRDEHWAVMPDLFFFRNVDSAEPEKKKDDAADLAPEDPDYQTFETPAASSSWAEADAQSVPSQVF